MSADKALASAAPSVLLCKGCSSIISDTLELRGEVADLGAYAVDGIENATIDSVQQQAHGGNGVSRTYVAIVCSGCGTAVGRCYSAVEEGLQHLQSRFLLDAATVCRWPLGRCKQRAPAQTQGNGADVEILQQQQQLQRIEQLEEAMLQVQHLMCVHSQRLEALSAACWPAEPATKGTVPPDTSQ